MAIDKQLSPQGYIIQVNPLNTNPFFDINSGGGTGGEGTTDYNQLHNRPFINGKVLEGNKDVALVTPEQLEDEVAKVDGMVSEEQADRIAADNEIKQTIAEIQLTPGPKGDDGKAATVSVGTVVTLESGTNASVTNVGTTSSAVLNFGIPKGVDGKNGSNGEAGKIVHVAASSLPYGSEPTVENQGTEEDAILVFGIPEGKPGEGGTGSTVTVNVGSTESVSSSEDAAVTNSGTDTNVVLNFKIPRGADGSPGTPGTDGSDGADGKAATVTVGTVTTLEAGSEATVSNSGTENAAVLNFGIPRGANGSGEGTSIKDISWSSKSADFKSNGVKNWPDSFDSSKSHFLIINFAYVEPKDGTKYPVLFERFIILPPGASRTVSITTYNTATCNLFIDSYGLYWTQNNVSSEFDRLFALLYLYEL